MGTFTVVLGPEKKNFFFGTIGTQLFLPQLISATYTFFWSAHTVGGKQILFMDQNFAPKREQRTASTKGIRKGCNKDEKESVSTTS